MWQPIYLFSTSEESESTYKPIGGLKEINDDDSGDGYDHFERPSVNPYAKSIYAKEKSNLSSWGEWIF